MSVPSKSIKSVAIVLAGNTCCLIVAIIFTPFLLRQLGPKLYGEVAFIWLILNILSSFDFGITRAHLIELNKNASIENAERATEQACIACILLFALSAPFVILGISCLHFLSFRFAVINQFTQYHGAIIAITYYLTMCNAIFITTIEAQKRYLESAMSKIFNALAYYAIPYLMHISGIPLVYKNMLLALFVARFAGAMMSILISAKNTVPRLSHQSEYKKYINRLLRQIHWISIENILSIVQGYLDRLMVMQLYGPALFGIYSTTSDLAIRSAIIPNALQTVMVNKIYAPNSPSRSKSTLRSMVVISAIMGFILCFVLISGDFLMRVWIGISFSDSASTYLKIAFIALFFSSIAYPAHAYLQFINKSLILARVSFASLFLSIISMLTIAKAYGSVGIALGMAISQCVNSLLINYYFMKWYHIQD